MFGYEPKPVHQRQLHSYDPPRPQTPLEVAVWHLSPELVENLLANGSTVTQRTLNMTEEHLSRNFSDKYLDELEAARDQIVEMLKAKQKSETTKE